MNYFGLILFVLNICVFKLISAQTTCAEDNGGCSHYCFDRGDGNGAQCSCPCGMELSSDKTCATSFPCTNEFYILIDISSYTDEAACNQLRAGGSPSFTQFKIWKESVLSILEMLETNSKTKFYTEAYSDSGAVIQNFNPSLSTTISFLTSLTAPGPKSCNDTNSPAEFDQVISASLDRIQLTTDRTGLTRTAILMVSDSSSKTNIEVASNLQGLRDNFDYVLFFTTNKAGDQDRTNLFRSVACQRPSIESTICPFLFFIDNKNDYNSIPTRKSIYNLINVNHCLGINYAAELSSCTGTMQLKVPKCLLGGYEPRDFQLLDDQCNVTTITTVENDFYNFHLPYTTCSTTRDVDIDDEIVTYSQTLSSRSMTTQLAISLDASCITPLLDQQDMPEILPVPNQYTSTTEISSNFGDFSVRFYSDAALTTLVSDSLETGNKIYVKWEGALPSKFKLILNTMTATSTTSSSSSPSASIFNNACPEDPTVKDINYIAQTFSFEMFEFTQTQNEQDADKLQVYFHFTFHVCYENSNDSVCNSCPSSFSQNSRRRREISEENILPQLSKSLGPFKHVSKTESSSIFETVNSIFRIVQKDFVELYDLDSMSVPVNLIIIALIMIGVLHDGDLSFPLISSLPDFINTKLRRIDKFKNQNSLLLNDMLPDSKEYSTKQ